MIWARRILTVPAGFVFFLFLLLTLLVLQINSTFLDPDYYPEQLREANVYQFVLNDLLASAIDEERERERREQDAGGTGEDVATTPLLSSGLSTEQIVAAVNRALPPDWVQGVVERNFDEVGQYLTGDRDEFMVTVRANEQAATAVEELKSLMRQADAFNLLFDEEVVPRIEESIQGRLPFGLDITNQRLVEAVRRVAPPEWVQEQVELVLDEVTPYMVGERDTFLIDIQLEEDRIDIALDEVEKLMAETDSGRLLYEEIVEPELRKNLGDTVALPLGVSLTQEEVLDALRQVAPPTWVEQQAVMVINDAAPYLIGRSDSFLTVVSLAENKRLARGVIADLVDDKVNEIVDNLPTCQSLAEAQAALATASEGLPSCVPPNVPTERLLDQLDIDLAGSIQRMVLGPIPDTIRFTEVELRTSLIQAGAADNLDEIDNVREILRDGWMYTQDDLTETLTDDDGNVSDVETLDNVRSFLADGWTYTEADLREDLSDEGDTGTVDDLDRGRDIFKTARSNRLLVYIPMLLLLVGIGFLGGTSWSARVAWGAGALVIATGLVFVIFGPGYDSFGRFGPGYDLDELRAEALQDITEEGGDYPETSRLAANKAFDIFESMADDLASGVASSSVVLVIIGLIALGAAIFWASIMVVARRYLPMKEQDGDG